MKVGDKVTVELDGLDALAVGQRLRRLALDPKTPPGERDRLRRVAAVLLAPWSLPTAERAEVTS